MLKKIGSLLLLFFVYIIIVYFGLMGGEVSGPPVGLSPWLGVLLLVVFPISMRNYLVWIFGGFIVEFIWFTILFFRAKNIFEGGSDIKKRILNILFLFALLALPLTFIRAYELEIFDFSNIRTCDSFLTNSVLGYNHDSCILGHVSRAIDDRYANWTFKGGKWSDINLYEKGKDYVSFANTLINECDLIKDEHLQKSCKTAIVTVLMNDRYHEVLRQITGVDDRAYNDEDKAKYKIITDNFLTDKDKGFELFKSVCLQDKLRQEDFKDCMRSVILGHVDVQAANSYSYCSDVNIPNESLYITMPDQLSSDPNIIGNALWKNNCEKDIKNSINEMKNGTINNGNIDIDIPGSNFHIYGFTYFNGEQIFDK